MRCRLLLLLLLFAVVPIARGQTAIFIARHAEKAEIGDPKDPDLSDVGRKRAESLGKMLRDAGVTAIYATEFKRTQQTAQPTAQAARVQVTIVPAQDTEALGSRLRDAKGSALVIAHSNTIPAIIKALGVEDPVTVADADYDNLFVILRDPQPRLVRLHY